MLKIEKANTEQDFAEIELLATEIWQEHYTPIIGEQQVAYMLDKFQSLAAMQAQVGQGYHYYSLKADSKLVGYLAFIKKEDALFLSKIYLHTSQRGLGRGKQAMEFVFNQASNMALTKVELTVNKYNSNSIAAYKAMGFVSVDSVVMDIGGGYVMDDFVMQITL